MTAVVQNRLAMYLTEHEQKQVNQIVYEAVQTRKEKYPDKTPTQLLIYETAMARELCQIKLMVKMLKESDEKLDVEMLQQKFMDLYKVKTVTSTTCRKALIEYEKKRATSKAENA